MKIIKPEGKLFAIVDGEVKIPPVILAEFEGEYIELLLPCSDGVYRGHAVFKREANQPDEKSPSVYNFKEIRQ